MDLIGRDAGVERLGALVAAPGVTTLVAPSGFGATGLALAAAEHIRIRDGGHSEAPGTAGDGGRLIRSCDLRDVTDDDHVATVVADQLGAMRSAPATTGTGTSHVDVDVDVDGIVSLVGARPAVLILCDVGQVVVGVSRLAVALRSACSDLSILSTSTTALQVAGEQVIELPPIRIDSSVLDTVSRRARELGASPDVDVTVELCERVGAAPLAMSMLAGQLAHHGPDEIAGGVLEQVAPVPSQSPMSDVAEHTERVARMVRWSYRQLSDDQQRLFDRLAIFQSGCSVSGALAIMVDPVHRALDDSAPEPLTRVGVADDHVDQVSAMLRELERVGLLTTSSGVAGVRWSMPEAIRHLGLAHLGQRNERSEVRNLHLTHMLTEVAVCASVSRGVDWEAGVERFGVLFDDVRLAVDWAIDAQRAPELDALFANLALFSRWSVYREPFEWSRRAWSRSRATGLPIGPNVLVHLALGAVARRDFGAAHDWATAAINAALTSDERSRGRRLAAISLVQLGRHDEAGAVVDALLSDLSDDPVDASMQLSRAAAIHRALGRLDEREARQMAGRASDLARSSQSPIAMAVVGLDSAEIALISGNADAARAHFEAALETGRRVGATALVEDALSMQLAQPGPAGLNAAASVLTRWAEVREPEHEFVVLESVAVNLIESGVIDAGATLIGHLDRDPRRSPSTASRRERATADLERYKRAPARRAAAADMTRDDAVALARAAVDAARS